MAKDETSETHSGLSNKDLEYFTKELTLNPQRASQVLKDKVRDLGKTVSRLDLCSKDHSVISVKNTKWRLGAAKRQ